MEEMMRAAKPRLSKAALIDPGMILVTSNIIYMK
jgi:hypothetical protein